MIQIPQITSLDLVQIKTAIEKLAREAQATQNPGGQEDAVYVDTAPADINQIKEGQFVPYFDGVNYRVYTRLNNTIRHWDLI